MPAIPKQRRYDQVMGDREPKVSDKRFVLELQQRLENRYLTAECLKEKRLTDAENRRVRKLVLDGVIDADDNQLKGHGDRGSHGDEWKEFWPQNPYKTLAEYQEDKKRKSDENSRSHQQEHDASQHETQRTEPETAEDGSTDGSKPAPSGGDGGANRPVTAGRYERGRSPRIDDLMVEEDLDQLYRKASEIVYIMAPPTRTTVKAGRAVGGKKH